MATVRPQQAATSTRYDAFVEEHLARARRRIRVLDVSSALLLFTGATLLYTLAVGLLDRKFDFHPGVRQVAFLGYAAASLVFLLVGVLRPLLRRINPYFAARAVEEVVPEAKNSVVNWLDLRGETLPPVIRASLGRRAASDLGKADLEQAISGRRALWLTAVTALLALVFFGVLVTSGTSGLGTLLARTFAPFGFGATAQRTQITVIRPANGDAIIGVGQSFNLAVNVAGRVPDPDKPDALKLLFRYRDGEPYEEQPLEPENGDTWMTVIPPSRTFNGFWYKVTGGDAQTEAFHVTVRSTPLIERIEVTYHYRPYTGRPDDRTLSANLKALRGTEAELIVHTNRPVKEGRLDLDLRDGKKVVPAELIPGDPQALHACHVMDQSGQYRIWFTATDGDSNLAAMPYTIEVLSDLPPTVELTEPGADVTLPANGTLRLKGSASDDIGVKELTLRLRPAGGAALKPKPYRPEKSLKLGERGYPNKVDYHDFVALDQLRDERGQPFPTARGMVLEYWLEATDACDYPGPNRGESKYYKVTIEDPASDLQQQKERGKAAEEQKKHDQNQDEKLKKEEQQRKDEAEQKKSDQANAQGKPEPSKGGQPDQPQKPNNQDVKNQAEKVGQALDKEARKEENDRQKGECKGGGDGKGDKKDDNQADSPEKGEAKPQGQNGAGQQGSAKGDGAKPEGQANDSAASKPQGAPHQTAPAGDDKGRGQGEEQGNASAKPDGPPKPEKASGKNDGKGEGSQGAAAPKDRGTDPKGARDEASAKGAGERKPGEQSDRAATKGDQPSVAKGAPKPGEAAGDLKGGEKSAGQAQENTARAKNKSRGPDRAGGGAAKDDPKQRDLPSELARNEQRARQGTDKESADSEKWLENLAKNANDREVRDLASRILEQARKDRASSLALPKEPPPADAKAGPPCECKGNGQGQNTGSAKTGGKDGTGKQQGTVQGKQGEARNGGTGRVDGSPTPLSPAQKELLEALRADEADPVPGDPAHRRRAGDLQLKDLQKIDKNVLKDLKMTPEELDAFKKAYAELPRLGEAEKLPQTQKTKLANQGAKEVQAEKGSNSGERTGLGQVPPEFRGPFRDYTRKQSEKK
jgi:hypothetical protein